MLDMFNAPSGACASTPPGALSAAVATLTERIARASALDRRALSEAMTAAYGTDDTSGAWDMRLAYDVAEAALATVILQASLRLRTCPPGETLSWLETLSAALPTQTYRAERQVQLQQFSTPAPLAFLASLAAAPTAADLVLEPSAGTGLLAAFARAAGAQLLLNEWDETRAALLAAVIKQPVSRHDAEMIDERLPPELKPGIVLVNPPFSRSLSRGEDVHAGARHLRSALLRLAPGGRCVAIMPSWFSAQGGGAAGYAAVSAVVPPCFDLALAGRAFAKHGTGVDVRIMVFDKGRVGDCAHHVASSANEALERLGELPGRLPLHQTRPVPLSACLAKQPRLPGSGSGLLRKGTQRRPVAPARSIAGGEAVELPYTVLETPVPAGDPVGLYAPYRVARIKIEGAKPHPTPLVESIAMSSILPPRPSYRPKLPPSAVAELSDAQLETVIYAGEAFERDLPGRFKPNEAATLLVEADDGQVYRQGWFLGDGTGAGKGRQVAGVILDQWSQGRRKHLWISASSALLEDARRDWCALGGLALDIQPLDAFPVGTAIPLESGILFVTYATLRSQRHDTASRLQQILEWLGPDHAAFEGVIATDEAHAMANAAGTETAFGTQKGSEQGLAGVRLQNSLPRARVLYVSATGATEIANLCYASRLGLWGPNTAFADRDRFMAAMEEGGIAAMELVARDLKAQGLYAARALSFAGVEYEMLEHELTPEQVEIYDAYADAWEIIHQNLDDALAATNIVDRIDGAPLNSNARNSALSRFESTKQRFFGQLLIAMKIPSLARAIEEELDRGHAVVIQLVTTAEAMLNRRLADLTAQERANLDIELSPREYVIDYLLNAFPTRMMRVFKDEQGNVHSEPMVDAAGNPVVSQEAVRSRDALVERLCGLPAVGSALDELIRRFGTDTIAEVTGRTKRLVFDSDDTQRLENRSARMNLSETAAFMSGRKRILAFSDAGGTGRSYHADLGCGSAGMRRVHCLLEPGWKASTAVQGLGRTHRTNQASAPIFRPVTTNCKGERRFISTIARRLDSLGALTRGQRQTGGQNLFDPADNLEGDYAREALTQWYQLLYRGKLASVGFADFVRMTGLRLIDKESGALLERLPPIQRWLNRLLALRIGVQNAIFEEYFGLIQARIDAAREAGTLDVGIETILAEKMIVLDEQVIRRDPKTGAETKLCRIELHQQRRPMSWARLERLLADSTDSREMRNARSGRVALVIPSYSVTDDEGRAIAMYQLIRPGGQERVRATTLEESHWQRIDSATFQRLWEAEVAEAATNMDISTIALATGVLLPVWNKLPSNSVEVWRLSDAQGNSLLGRIIPASAIGELASAMGVSMQIRLTPKEVIAGATAKGGVQLRGLEPAKLVTSLVNGSNRLEIKDYPPGRLEWLKSCGCFTQIISYKTRLFVPLDSAEAVVARLSAPADA